ncbi:MAG TPA: hypothetical protein VFW78_06895 [Bacteroidia bacterium]|nr:hypothetical protein [Bacteroidia bacterium]
MSLKILQELSSVVTKDVKKDLFKSTKKGSKTDQLIKTIVSDGSIDEEALSAKIYSNSLTGRSFDMLKSRAKEQLINAIFQLDTKKRFKSSFDRAYYTACKELLAGLILLRQNRENAGLQLIKHSLQISKKHYFTEFTFQSLKILRYFSSFSGSRINFRNYNKQLEETLNVLKIESMSDQLNQQIILHFGSSAASQIDLDIFLKKCYEKAQTLNQECDTYSTRMNMYRIGIHYFDSIKKYENLIMLAEKCEQYLNRNPHLIQKVRIGEMNLNKLYGSLHLRNLKDGIKYAQKCESLFNYGSLNFLIFNEYYFLLCLHTNEPQRAESIYYSVIQHSGFSNYPQRSIEKWKIFEAFLHYTLPESNDKNKKFNTARFVNEVPIFSKDKAGYNFSIIIAQIILLIKNKDYESVVMRSDSLKLYAARYIKKEKSPRSYYFLKMLQVMIKYDFDPVKTEKIAAKFFDKLKATRLGEQNELETLEVIPYDLLWPKLLDQLRN